MHLQLCLLPSLLVLGSQLVGMIKNPLLLVASVANFKVGADLAVPALTSLDIMSTDITSNHKVANITFSLFAVVVVLT